VQRIALALFGGFFVLLFIGVALAVGVNSEPAVPPGDVAYVEGAPPWLADITRAEYEREMRHMATLFGLGKEFGPSDPHYARIKLEAAGLLVSAVWMNTEAIRMGVPVTHQQIVERLAPEKKNLEKAGFTPKEMAEHVRWQLKKISALINERRQAEFFNQVEMDWRGEWQLKTRCVKGFVAEECANFPLFEHSLTAPTACFEADPKEPADECPASVTQPTPAQPGSVRWWHPEGDRRIQRPVPPGGGAMVGEVAG
jgi:hypothetical protein